MSTEVLPLVPGETGPYGELAARPLPKGYVLQHVPALAAMLSRAEQLKGEPLEEAQVLKLRDACPALVVEAAMAQSVEANRGYGDVDPNDPWPSWQALRPG